MGKERNKVQQLADLKRFKLIALDKLVKASWNYKTDDEEKAKKLKANIKRNGQIENLIVRELDTGFFEVANGNHRLDVFEELEMTHAVCYDLGQISAAEAKRIAIETNETRFRTDQLELAALLKELSGEFDINELETTLPYTHDELDGFLKLLDFDWNQYGKQPPEPHHDIRIVISTKQEHEEKLREELADLLDRYPGSEIVI